MARSSREEVQEAAASFRGAGFEDVVDGSTIEELVDATPVTRRDTSTPRTATVKKQKSGGRRKQRHASKRPAREPRPASPVSFQPASSNSKLATVLKKPHPNGRFQTFPQAPFVSSTYASISATCPSSCVFRDHGCYVQAGTAADKMDKLDTAATERKLTGRRVNELEAELIDRQFPIGVPGDGYDGGRDLRLHVGGDTADEAGAVALAGAVDRWRARLGGKVWTYTHNWRAIPLDAFGSITVLASVETLEGAAEAIDLGYTPAITLAEFASDRAYKLAGELKVVPCPAQTRGLKCVDCRLCMRQLPRGTAIGFAVHGQMKRRAQRRLRVLGGPG